MQIYSWILLPTICQLKAKNIYIAEKNSLTSIANAAVCWS